MASCYRGALGVIIVFEVTNKISFRNIKQWMVEMDQFSEAEFASQNNIAYIETSVIGRSNIKVQNIIQLSSSYNSIYFRRHS